MSPNSPETRIGTLEQNHARLEQRVTDLAEDMRALAPVRESMARSGAELEALARDVATVKKSVAEIDANLKNRDNAATSERQATRRALIALTAAIMAALIAGIFTVIAAALA